MLALLLAIGVVSAGGLERCTPTKAERVEVLATRNRLAARPRAPDLRPFQRYPQPACGIWRVHVGPGGGIRALKREKEGGDHALVLMMEPWLRTFRFKPSPRPWSGLVAVRLNEEQNR